MKRDISKFVNDPEFHFITEMLSKNTENMRDINTIDINLPAETIKAIVAGRQETLKLVDTFINEIEVSKKISNNTPTSFT